MITLSHFCEHFIGFGGQKQLTVKNKNKCYKWWLNETQIRHFWYFEHCKYKLRDIAMKKMQSSFNKKH